MRAAFLDLVGLIKGVVHVQIPWTFKLYYSKEGAAGWLGGQTVTESRSDSSVLT